MPTQQQIARKFVGEVPDVIVAITTPTSQAMVAATKDIQGEELADDALLLG
jgi:putative tryptophan/tyrosine transport system substrate-binding protein